MDSAALRKLMMEVARRDLGEDENVRELSIRQFKNWLETNPDVRNYNGDEEFVLLYLRKGKFSIQKSQEIFLKCETFRNDYPELMRDVNILDPKVNPFARNGYIFVSPVTDDNGRHTVCIQLSKFDPSKCNYTDHLRAQVVTSATLMYKQVPQVLGLHYVIDMADVTAAHLAHIPITVMIPFLRSAQQNIPLRFKGFFMINMPPAMKWFFDLVVSHVTEKMKTRYMAPSSLEELHKYVSPQTLPKEYGGTMSSQEMIDWWYQEMLAARPTVIEWSRIRLVQANNSDLKTSLAQLPGSFRKLEMD